MNPPNRRRFLKMTAAATAAYVMHRAAPAHAARPAPTEAGSRRPNVVFVFSDTHRWQSMSFTEMPGMSTPNMARMASQGLSMHRTISNFPICSPYRAMLMTGRWPYKQVMADDSPGMIDNDLWLSGRQATLGSEFRRAGYKTGYIGKWHLGGRSAVPFGFGLSIVWRNTRNHWDSEVSRPGGIPRL